MDGGPEGKLAVHNTVFWLGMNLNLARCRYKSEATGQNLHATCLVDEVERTAFEGEFLVYQRGVARQEHHRQGHAALAQFG